MAHRMNSSPTSDRVAALRMALAQWDIPCARSIDYLENQDHVFIVKTAERAFTLKDVGSASLDLPRLEFLRGVLEHVAARGLTVPIPIRSRSGQMGVESAGSHYLLFQFIDAGEFPEDARNRAKAFFQAGMAIAELHKALASYSDDDLSSKTWRENLSGSVPRWLDRLGEGLPDHQSAVVKQVGRAHGSEIERALDGLPEQLIHRDCHPGNVLVDGVRVIGFIDCDHLCIGPPLFDLATYAVHHMKWRVNDRSVTGAWLGNIPRLLDGYRSRHTFCDRESHAFPYMMMTYHILLSDWFMGRSHTAGIQTEIDALSWMHDNFDKIVGSIALQM